MSRQATINIGRCDHSIVEEVKNYGGDTIAYRCTGCTTITSHVGLCGGCGQHRKLTKHVAGRVPKRYCTEDCYRNALRAKRAAEKSP